eukprot:COSAG06_NODE_36326_length_448_cov_1.180516_1_plen_27_part_10
MAFDVIEPKSEPLTCKDATETVDSEFP